MGRPQSQSGWFIERKTSCLCWESNCDLTGIQPVGWKLHRLTDPGNYTDCPTLETTQTAWPWKLHRLPYHGNYTDCPTLETTQTTLPWKLHRLPYPANYPDYPTLETTQTARSWKLHRLPDPGSCWSLFLQEIPFRSSKGEIGNNYTECKIGGSCISTAEDSILLGWGTVLLGTWLLLLRWVMVRLYAGLTSPRKIDCITLNIMALTSLKTTRTGQPVTQCNIP
jgi:hypothetical protein